MKATDEQIALLRMLDDTLMVDEDTGAALTAVLSELTELRSNMAALTDSGIEPPRLVFAVCEYLRQDRDGCLDEVLAAYAAMEAALAECQK